MAVSATDIVAPVLAAAKVVVFLSTGMTAQTRFGRFFRRLVFERNDLLRVAFFDVGLAWTMARLATRHLFFPTGKLRELSVRGVREVFELIFVTIFTDLTADVVARLGLRELSRTDWRRLRRVVVAEQTQRS